MRQHAIQRVNDLFTWAKVAHMISALYDRILLANDPADDRAVAFIKHSFDHAAETFTHAKNMLAIPILEASSMLVKCFSKNKKVLICGNGGSAAESQHFAGELVGRFEMPERKGLPAISLTADSSILTAWANDFSYDDIFARQVEAYGQQGDILFCFSTSGQSANIINAVKAAKQKQMLCIALTGKGGGEVALYADVNIVIPSDQTQRIQELHLHILHTICSLIEASLISKTNENKVNSAHHNGKLNGDGKQFRNGVTLNI
jgi:D-inositol-3-phosphate glycosyltransferase